MRTFAIVTLSIFVPIALTSLGLEADALAIGSGFCSLIALGCLLWTFERVRRGLAFVTRPVQGTLTQALIASSLTLLFGIGAALTWSDGEVLHLMLAGAAILSVNWWLQVLVKSGLSRLAIDNRDLRRKVGSLEEQIRELLPAGNENQRIRAVLQHAMNVLLGLEAARDGRVGVSELGVQAWIEYVCLRSTRDLLQQLPGRPDDYRIELGILRVPNEVVFVEMAAGDELRRHKEQGGCPVNGAPDGEDILKILEKKAALGGFSDSDAVEFNLNGEPHHMVALSTAPLDDVDRQLLSLIASMFIVLTLSLENQA